MAKYKNWTEEEDNYIMSHYPTEGRTPLAEKFGVSKNAVTKRALYLGAKSALLWNEDDTKKLEYLYLETSMSVEDIAKEIEKTVCSVKGKLFHMDFRRYGHNTAMTTMNIKFIKDNFHTMSRTAIAVHVGSTPGNISRIASILKLGKSKYCRKKDATPKSNLKDKPWTTWQTDFLIEHHDRLHISKMRVILGNRSISSITMKIRRLGLNKTKLKYHSGTLFGFYYIAEEEKKRKLDYMMFWRDYIYVEYKRKIA